MSSKLKPCPCGGEAEYFGEALFCSVSCKACKSQVGWVIELDQTAKVVINAWNRMSLQDEEKTEQPDDRTLVDLMLRPLLEAFYQNINWDVAFEGNDFWKPEVDRVRAAVPVALQRIRPFLLQHEREAVKPMNVIRLDEDGEVVDVAITGDLFRMERMNDGDWWVCIYRGQNRTAFLLTAKSNNDAFLQEDTIGCLDDAKEQGRRGPVDSEGECR